MSQKWTRRQTLKLMAVAAAATLSPLFPARARPAAVPLTPEPQGDNRNELYGRAIHAVSFHQEPDRASERLNTRQRDEGFRILGEVRAPFSAHNDLWYHTELGYVHSAWVLPVRVYPPQPFIQDLGSWGFWGEVSQIHTEGRVAPSHDARRQYRFYGGTVYRVIDAVEDNGGEGWYKVVDDYPPRQTENHQWVLARDMRRIPRAEMAPLSPFASDKRVEIDLTGQSLTCYEGDTAVMETRVSTGTGQYATQPGEYCVLLKQASRHMSNVPYEGGPDTAPEDIFDLPGVPWNVFITLSGIAIHGSYWHNDYGIPRSHGCINVPIPAAQFIYRWVHPIGAYEDDFIRSNCRVGTRVIIR